MATRHEIKTAVAMLRKIGKNATDATAFKVEFRRNTLNEHYCSIDIVPDTARRKRANRDNKTFFHAAEVLDIDRAFHLSPYGSAFLMSAELSDKDGVCFRLWASSITIDD